MHLNDATPQRAEDICLSCGLCCNGVIFKDVKLQTGDNFSRLRTLGLRVLPAVKRQTFLQPCSALEGCQCRIYPERPKHCREFQCLLLQNLRSGGVTRQDALRMIRTARRRVGQVRRLMRQLGNNEEHLPLATRFRRTSNQLAATQWDSVTAGFYGRLTLAFHRLNLLLSESFYH